MELRPDVVLANEEENRQLDLDALRAAGVPVWVTMIRDLPEAFTSLRRMITLACRLPGPAWLDTAAAAWQQPLAPATARAGWSAVVPIWRRPWMVLGRDTFAGDLLARLGVTNIYGCHQERYPRVDLGELRCARADLVVLPDEPYRFTASDGPEARQRTAPDLVRAIADRGTVCAAPPACRGPDPVIREMTTPPGASAHEGVPTPVRGRLSASGASWLQPGGIPRRR